MIPKPAQPSLPLGAPVVYENITIDMVAAYARRKSETDTNLFFSDDNETTPWCTPPSIKVIDKDEYRAIVKFYSDGCGRNCCELGTRLITFDMNDIIDWCSTIENQLARVLGKVYIPWGK